MIIYVRRQETKIEIIHMENAFMKMNKFYAERFWYRNTYESLGSRWLMNSIEKLKVKNNYVFINLSANAGCYERDVYEKHFSQYNPTYYIGDVMASKLKDKKVDSFKQFNYIPGDNNAITMDISIILDKADILMDCKGALWHAIADRKRDKAQLIQLLENYSKLLNDSGVLLMDYYKTTCVEDILQLLKWIFGRYRRRKTSVNCFGELSTYAYLINLYGRKNIDTLLKPLNIKEEIPGYPLSKIMDTAYISKEDLDELIEITNSLPEQNFCLVGIKRCIKPVLFGVVLLCFVISLCIFCIY